MIKKIVSVIIISSLFFGNSISVVAAQSKNIVEPQTKEEVMQKYKNYEKLVKNTIDKQTKTSQSIEVELFILQNNLVDKYLGTGKQFNNLLMNNIGLLQKSLAQDSVYNSKTGFNLTATMSDGTKLYEGIMGYGGKTENDGDKGISKGLQYIKSKNRLMNGSTKFDIDTNFDLYKDSNKNSILFSIKNFKYIFDSNYNKELNNFYITKNNFEKTSKDIQKSLYNFNKFYFINKGKNILINNSFFTDTLGVDNGIVKKISNVSGTDIFENQEEVIELLKKEKIFLVYKSLKNRKEKGQMHYLMLNPIFVTELYTLTGIDLLEGQPVRISGKYLSQMQKHKTNAITRLDTGLFKHISIIDEKDNKQIRYSEFNKTSMIKFFIMTNDKSKIFLNKDTIKYVSGDNRKQLYSYFNDDQLQLKYQVKTTDMNISYIVFIKDEYSDLYGKIIGQTPNYKGNLNFYSEAEGDTITGYAKGSISKTSDKNKKSDISLRLQLSPIKGGLDLNFNFQEMIFPIKAKGNLISLYSVMYKDVNLTMPKADITYHNGEDFLNKIK